MSNLTYVSGELIKVLIAIFCSFSVLGKQKEKPSAGDGNERKRKREKNPEKVSFIFLAFLSCSDEFLLLFFKIYLKRQTNLTNTVPSKTFH